MFHYELFSDNQHGFLPNKSCISQLLTAMNHLTESLNSGYSVDIIYFDFSKAFDSVPHYRLLTKLRFYGICMWKFVILATWLFNWEETVSYPQQCANTVD